MKLLALTFACVVALAMATVGDRANAAAVFKCERDDGSVSFQDQPCKADESEEVRQGHMPQEITAPDGMKLVRVPIPGVGEAIVPLLGSLEYRVRQHDGQAATIAFRALPDQHPLELQITFFANRNSAAYTEAEARQVLAAIDRQLVHTPEPTGQDWTFAMSYSEAEFNSLQQPPSSLGGNDGIPFDTVTSGFAMHPRVVTSIIILNKGGTSDTLRQALKIINATHIIDADSKTTL